MRDARPVALGLDPLAEFERALADLPPELREQMRALVSGRSGRVEAALTPADLDSLERVGVAVSAALLLDLAGRDGERRTG